MLPRKKTTCGGVTGIPSQAPWLDGRVSSGYWKDVSNRRRYIQWLGIELGFKKPEDWYRITLAGFQQNHGTGFLDYYARSPSAAVMDNIQFDWKPWLFKKAPGGLWDDAENRRLYMRWLGERLGFTKPEDWYQLQQKHFLDNSGSTLVQWYNGSPCKVLQEYIPDYEWKEWLMVQAPKRFWHEPLNRRRYMEWLGASLDFVTADDWYRVTTKDFADNGGAALLGICHRGSPYLALKEYFPQHDWKSWLFTDAPKKTWQSIAIRRQYMEWLGSRLGYRKPEDWYHIRAKDLTRYNGVTLLKYYNQSIFQMVMKLVPPPEGGWVKWKFFRAPQEYWEDETNRRRYMGWLGGQLNFNNTEDWYAVTRSDFRRNHGLALLEMYYRGSPALAVMARFPKRKWLRWLFYRVPNKFWENIENRKSYMQWLGRQLGFTKKTDWYRITSKDFIAHSGGGLLVAYGGSPIAAVAECFPGDWEPHKFCERLKMQNKLLGVIKKLFPSTNVRWNYRHDGIRFPGSNRRMELDIFLPNQQLAIEYQGEQHFMPIAARGGEDKLRLIQARDRYKKMMCKKLGIRLIEIDYRWDGRLEPIREAITG